MICSSTKKKKKKLRDDLIKRRRLLRSNNFGEFGWKGVRLFDDSEEESVVVKFNQELGSIFVAFVCTLAIENTYSSWFRHLD